MTELWKSALSDIRSRLSEENFEAWLAPIQFEGIVDGTVLLRIPNRFCADWVRTHYLDLILDSLRKNTGKASLDVKWEIDEKLAARTQAPSRPSPVPKAAPYSDPTVRNGRVPLNGEQIRATTGLNPRYSFENFVVGPSNQLANAASIAAASSPGSRYNPLFIYGGVGLGKTHLVNAIGHRVLESDPGARILFVSAERFTNEFIRALQHQEINEFRDRYRCHYDVLLMDDIQFLATREQTQEEFFHTFNALYHSDKQIVVSCDVYPQQIREMQERLVSRFQWGMVADIQAPELDTRVAIVKKKAEQEGINLPDDVALLLAETICSNVRELEGTLLRLAVKAEILRRTLDLEFAQEALRTALPQVESAATVEDIQRAVCEYFNIRLMQLKSHRRHRSIAHPRMIAMYLCRKRLGTSYTELGLHFGGKDHTTIMSGVRKIGGLVQKADPAVSTALETIERKLKP